MTILKQITLLSLWITVFVCCQGIASGTPGPTVTAVISLPDFITTAKAYNRDAGRSAKLGNGKILWVFDDTFNPSGELKSATGGWANVSKPNVLTEEVDANGIPLQLYPFTPAEFAYNEQQKKADPCCQQRSNCSGLSTYCNCPAQIDCTSRLAMWNERPYTLNSTTILLIYSMLKIGFAGDVSWIGMGLAHSKYPSTTVSRVMTAPNQPLYVLNSASNDIGWDSFTIGKDGAFIYFQEGPTNQYCWQTMYMARVPIGKIADKSAFTYWNGSTFISDVSKRQPIGYFWGGLGSCMWSSYLKAYLSFSMGFCSGPTGQFRTAPNPWGPWSDNTGVDLAPYGAIQGSYAAELHPDLSTNNNVVISYFVPRAGFSGLIVTRQLTFQV